MNVDRAFILAEICRKTSVLLFVDTSMQIYLIMNLGRCLSNVSHCHTPLKKKKKNDQMMSNSVSAQNFLALWTLNHASLCSGVWIHAIRACFKKYNIL